MHAQPTLSDPLPSAAETVPSLKTRVQREQVAALYATIVSATVADVAVAWTLVLTFYLVLKDWHVLIWLGLHIAQTATLPLLTVRSKSPDADRQSLFWARRYQQQILIYSAVWGLAAWFLLPADNVPMAALLMLVLMGLCSAGVPSVAPVKPVIYAFCIPMLVGLTTALAWHGGPMYWFMAVCSVVYLAITLRFAMQQNALLTRSLIVRFEKEALAEQLAEQVAVVERASAEKTRFFAAASHDLRQPLHAIALFGAVLEKELAGRAEQIHAIRMMRAVHALGTSLDTMLDLSRLDAGVIVAEIQAASLNPLFQSLNQLFASRAEEKGLQLRLRASPLAVRTDPALLLRLLTNLVENAIKYTPQGGVLVVARTRGTQVWIDVCDTGIGIAARHLGNIFEEFYQGNNPGRDRSQGLGIGLSIVRRLSDLLGHSVQVNSRPGRGSRFRVVVSAVIARESRPLPSTPFKRDADNSRPSVLATALPQRVLLIDDEIDIGDAMAALLGSHGVYIHVSHDEAEASVAFTHAATHQQPFDALLCDYRLANGVDGLDMALRLRARFAPQLPLLLVTGDTAPDRLQRVRDSGVAVLFKPVAANALLHALADLTEAQQASPQKMRSTHTPQPL